MAARSPLDADAPAVIRIGRACLLAACLSPALAAPLAAQQEPLTTFWNALEAVDAPGEVATVAAPPELDDGIAESLRLLREYEFSRENNTAYRARWELQRAIARNPNSAAHHLALAMLLRRGPDGVQRLDKGEDNGFVDPRSLASAHARRALHRALELDPTFELAAVELARFALERHDPKLLAEAEAVLAGMEPTAEVLMQRAALALEQENTTAALTHASAAMRAGADPSRVAHTRAVALLLNPDTERMGAAAYLSGLENASEVGVREYHDASSSTYSLGEWAAWDTMQAERRADWMRERWEIRAALGGVSLAERLGVHFRRLYQAYREYPLYAPMRDAAQLAGMGVLMGEDPRRHRLSPMGLMLTRFGDPARFRWLGVCGNDIPYLRTDPLSMGGPLDSFLPPGHYRPVDEIDILHSEDSKLLRSLDCSNPAAFRQFAQAMLEGERYRPQYDDVVEVQTEIYAFRAPDGSDVHVAITMRRSDVEAAVDAYGSVTLNTAVAFIDTVARATSRSGRTLQFRVPDNAATHVLLNAPVHTQLHGELDVRVTVEDPARRIGAVLGVMHAVPDFSGTDLQLSDVVIAPSAAATRMQRGDVQLAVAAGRKYRVGETFDLYYEVYGLADDARYRTRVVVAPESATLWRVAQRITGTEPDIITLEFDGIAATPHDVYGTQELRSLGTSTLRPGTYRLRVTIENLETGATATRDRLFDIVD